MVLSKRSAITVACLILVSGFGSLASAERLVVTSDKLSYSAQDTIRITIENPTETTVYGGSNPWWCLKHVDSECAVDGCGGILMSMAFPPGFTTTKTYRAMDLLFNCMQGGTYRFSVEDTDSGPKDEILGTHVDFEITNATPAERRSWGEVKARYR